MKDTRSVASFPASQRNPHLVIGLMSGTSCDGIDAALVAIRGGAKALRVELIAFETVPYPPAVRRLIAEVSSPPGGTVEKICQANFLLGELFAEAAVEVARKARVPMSRVDLIGSHGQTIHHLPEPTRIAGRRVASTLQIGEPSVIAERTGVTTVADFRPRDMACGGQGAPLVPYVDYLLFRHRSRGRLVLNIGGIANFTYLPPACRPEQVVAFDTGPGNMLLDALTSVLTDGRESYDRDGAMAAEGTVSEPLLRWLMRHPYLRRRPPKSTGREMFGAPFASEILQRAECARDDHPMPGSPDSPVPRSACPTVFLSSDGPGAGGRSDTAGQASRGTRGGEDRLKAGLLSSSVPRSACPTVRSGAGLGDTAGQASRGTRGGEDRLKAGLQTRRREDRLKAGLRTKNSAFGVPPLGGLGLPPDDLLATVTAFTAESICDAWRRFIRPLGPVHEVIASGGGCHNQTLMRRLSQAFDPIPVRLSDDFGVPVDAKEAIAFAILARETMAGRPGNLPSATGARRPAVLGKIVPGGGSGKP